LHIFFDTIYSYLLWGFLFNNSYEGGSVAKAKEANVSIIKLIHNNYTGVNISYLIIAAPINVAKTATTFTVN
jgi:hypothetical protein